MTSPGGNARGWGPSERAAGGCLWAHCCGVTQPLDRAECLAFFQEVSKVRQLGWDPVYLTLAPPGGPRASAAGRTAH